MSAPSIPNLLSLRGNGARRVPRSRGGAGGDGPAGGRGGLHHGPDGGKGYSDDITIQGTDSDAAVSRFSAVSAGYLDDPYARYFVSAGDGPPARRFPIINRGTYTRTRGIDRLVDSFLLGGGSSDAARQIISLGAGTDTRPFRLFQDRQHPRNLIYHEIDFPGPSARKLRTVEATPQLDSILGNRAGGEAGHWSSRPSPGSEYHSHGVDIRSLRARPPFTGPTTTASETSTSTETTPTSTTTTSASQTLPGLRTELPTLILSECCLCYLHPDEAERVLSHFTSRIRDLSIVIYEPVHLGDAFGETMVANLAARRIFMPTLERFRTPGDQEARLRGAGFDAVRHLTIDGVWEGWVERGERERVDGLEGLDEVEEWKLLAGHYLVVWGKTEGASAGGDFLRV